MGAISNEIRVKAEILVRDGKVKKDLDTEKRVYFEVNGDSENHSVIFDKKTGEFFCDCRYFTLNQRECSHILAAKMKKES